MPELIATSPFDGRAAVTRAATTLAEAPYRQMTSVAPRRGHHKAVAGALKALGLSFPQPNRFVEAGLGRIVWTGRDQAFLIGVAPDGLAPHAALTDQSDGWAVLVLAGPRAEAALARIVPIDVRVAVFAQGHAARVPFNHMACVLMRTGAQAFEIMVFRSMARTAWHEVDTALTALCARDVLV